jgi:hypothetical protein
MWTLCRGEKIGPLNWLVWWEVPLGYIALGSFLFLQEQVKDIIINVLVVSVLLPIVIDLAHHSKTQRLIAVLEMLELDPNFETHVFVFLHWNYLVNEYITQYSFLDARMDHASHASSIYNIPEVTDKRHTHGFPD